MCLAQVTWLQKKIDGQGNKEKRASAHIYYLASSSVSSSSSPCCHHTSNQLQQCHGPLFLHFLNISSPSSVSSLPVRSEHVLLALEIHTFSGIGILITGFIDLVARNIKHMARMHFPIMHLKLVFMDVRLVTPFINASIRAIRWCFATRRLGSSDLLLCR